MPRKSAPKQKQKQRQSQRVVVNIAAPPKRRRAPRRRRAPKQSVEEAEYIAALNRTMPAVQINAPIPHIPQQQIPILQPESVTGLANVLVPEFSRIIQEGAMRVERQVAAQKMQSKVDEAVAEKRASRQPAEAHPMPYLSRSVSAPLAERPVRETNVYMDRVQKEPDLAPSSELPVAEAVVLSQSELEAERKRIAEEAVRKAEADRKEMARIRRADNKKAADLAKAQARTPAQRQRVMSFDVVDEESSAGDETAIIRARASKTAKKAPSQSVVDQWFSATTTKSSTQPGL